MNRIVGIIQCIVLFVLVPLSVNYGVFSLIVSLVFGFGIVFLLGSFLMFRADGKKDLSLKQERLKKLKRIRKL